MSFPHFEELGVVYGKDRADGGNVEGPTKAVVAMEAKLETQLNNLQVNESIGVNMDEIEAEYEADSQVYIHMLLFLLTIIFVSLLLLFS